MSATITDKLIGELSARASNLGFVLAARCIHCKAPIWNQKSLAAHAGPVCRARHKYENDPGTLAKDSAAGAVTTH